MDAEVTGKTLVTTWTSSSGSQSTTTTRSTGESDADFRDRHVQAYLSDMLGEQPVP
jgi:hypothetical protein